VFSIEGQTVRLCVRAAYATFGHDASIRQIRSFVSGDTQSRKRPKERLYRTGDEARLIGIFYPQQKCATVPTSKKNVIERGSQSSNVQIARR
jgi:hypothetical protein